MAEKKPYKVVLEALTQEKKKLKSTVIYDEQAPPGYTFCPIGAPELAHYCKELSRKRGVDIGIVSTRPKNTAHRDPTNVSHHIHRVGYHFRNDVFDVAFTQLGLKGSGSRRALRPRGPDGRVAPTAIARRMDSYGASMSVTANESAQERQKRMVSLAIKDLFPKIPEEDQRAILARAFEEGSDRIGTQEAIPLPRRVQLAVLAHVRHTKTDYDNLLKIVGWHDARRLVEQTCLDQIVKWRGETDEGDGELEDIFQEVIVLDDDDKEETRDATARQEHESSVEVIADQRHPEDVDVDAYSPPPLTTKQSVPKEQPRSDSPTVISVMPLRAPKPAPLLTHQAFNDRLQDTKHRVGHGRGPEPMMVPEHQTNVAPAQSRQGQAREETRSKSTANASSYALDREVVEERLLQRRLPSQKISFRPPQAQVYQSIEHASEQQRPRAQPDAVRRAMPQRSLPRSTVMPQRPHEIMPYDRPPAQTKPPVPPPQYVGLQNGRTAHVEATSQRGVEPSRDDRQHQEVIDLTETSPVAQKTATKTRVNARPTSLTARQRTRSRSPDRGQMYHEPDPRPVNDSQYYRDDGRRSYAQPEYRERRDPFHRRPEAGYDGDRRRLHEFDALGNRLERYAMYDLEDDEIRGAQFRVQDLQQAPPRPRSAGHYVVRNRLERLYDRDAAYADRAALSREYYPQKDQWPPADRYRDRSDLYLVPHRPA